MNITRLSLFFFFLLAALPLQSQLPFEMRIFATGLNTPVDIIHADSSLMYVVEKGGRIRILLEDGSLGPYFLDITDRVNTSGGERGLLGLVFHPNYPDSAYIYVNYTGSGGHTRISCFEVTADTTADPDSEEVLLTINQPFSNHNGGDLEFGTDGYLYIALGDGGSGGDPQNHGQNLQSLLGKILRIDVDGSSPYGIPPDNPFVGDTSGLDEIWVYGVRNPWRIDYDSIAGGLFLADVGQNTWEEIDFVPSQGFPDPNYGWRCYEGNHVYDLSECGDVDTLIFPIFEYQHTSSGCSGSISGGVVYRGSRIPQLYGKYLYGDYCSGQLGSVDVDNGYQADSLLDFDDFEVITFGTDQHDELYMATIGDGIIYKFVPTDTHYIFSIDLDGSQAGSGSSGSGYGIAHFETDSNQLCVSGHFDGVSGTTTAVVVHLGDAGQSGPAIFSLQVETYADTAESFYGCNTLNPDLGASLTEDGMYVDIHTTGNPGGDIRGQIIRQDCPEQFDTSVPSIPSGEYKAQQLLSAGWINDGFDIIFRFASSAEFNNGFHMEAGAVMEVLKGGCQE